MEDIGLIFKEAREKIGITINEVATDLKIDTIKIESIEKGEKEEFKDINVLKTLIVDYSKYLGLDPDFMIDEFNEFLFDHTSRIPIEEIIKTVTEEKNEADKQEVKVIASPYTLERETRFEIKHYHLFGVIALLIFIIIFFIISLF